MREETPGVVASGAGCSTRLAWHYVTAQPSTSHLLMTVCSAVTTFAATTTASTVDWGAAPWPPFPAV